MKRIIIPAIIIGTLSLALFVSAQGLQDAGTLLGKVGGENGEKIGVTADLPTAIATVIKTVLALVGTIFLALTIYAGVLWMTAQGEEEKAKKARDIITMAVIGLVVVMSAYAITYFVTSKLTGSLTGPTNDTPVNIGCCGNGDGLRPSTAANCTDVGDIFKGVECNLFRGCCTNPNRQPVDTVKAACQDQGDRWEATESGGC